MKVLECCQFSPMPSDVGLLALLSLRGDDVSSRLLKKPPDKMLRI
jgi:hypothetical protein